MSVKNKKRYRYISSGIAVGSEKIRNFRLIGGRNVKASYDGKAVIRVCLPDDLIIEKWSCDSYSTTKDERTIEELEYDVLIWNESKGRWRIYNEYKGTKLCDIPII